MEDWDGGSLSGAVTEGVTLRRNKLQPTFQQNLVLRAILPRNELPEDLE